MNFYYYPPSVLPNTPFYLRNCVDQIIKLKNDKNCPEKNLSIGNKDKLSKVSYLLICFFKRRDVYKKNQFL